MNQIVDLTGNEASADVAAMEIDATHPIENTDAPVLGSSTVPPALAPQIPSSTTTAPPIPVPAPVTTRAVAPAQLPPNGLIPSAHELRHSQREKIPSRQRILMDQIGEQPQQLRMTRRHGKISLQEMQAHLDTVSIGLRPSDTTAIDLPDELPPPIHPSNSPSTASDVEIINLSEWTQERINALAATTVVNDPFSHLLGEPPLAPKDRLGRFTGQQNRDKLRVKPRRVPSIDVRPSAAVQEGYVEKKREKKVVSVAVAEVARPSSAGGSGGVVTREERIHTLHTNLGQGRDVPWISLGRTHAVRAGGSDISVLSLWAAVQKFGGFREVTSEKLWSAVGRELGVDTKVFHGVDAYKNAYAKFLLPYELYLKHIKEEEEDLEGPVTLQQLPGVNEMN